MCSCQKADVPCQRIELRQPEGERVTTSRVSQNSRRAFGRGRTCTLPVRSRTLCPLSHEGVSRAGFEPAILSFGSWNSVPLSYRDRINSAPGRPIRATHFPGTPSADRLTLEPSRATTDKSTAVNGAAHLSVPNRTPSPHILEPLGRDAGLVGAARYAMPQTLADDGEPRHWA